MTTFLRPARPLEEEKKGRFWRGYFYPMVTTFLRPTGPLEEEKKEEKEEKEEDG